MSAKKEVRIFAAVWGRDYLDLFLSYNLLSIKGDIQNLSENFCFCFVIYCETKLSFEICENLKRLFGLDVKIEIFKFSQFGINDYSLPRGEFSRKYEFLASLHKHFFDNSDDSSILVFNYSDFYWSPNCLSKVCNWIKKENNGAVFSFCPPVERAKILNFNLGGCDVEKSLALDSLIRKNFEEILHVEAKRRYISSPEFSVMPTYLIWPQGDGTLIFHSYHHTVLALDKGRLNKNLQMGKGTLDGYFSAKLFEYFNSKGVKIKFLNNFDKSYVVSLHKAEINSSSKKKAFRGGQDIDQILERMFEIAIAEAQLPMSKIRFYWLGPRHKIEQFKKEKRDIDFIDLINRKWGKKATLEGNKIPELETYSRNQNLIRSFGRRIKNKLLVWVYR